MKTFKKIKLNDFPTLDDQEMKKIIGSYGKSSDSNTCPNGGDPKEYWYRCTFEATYEGHTTQGQGIFRIFPGTSICYCEALPGYS